MSNLKPWDDLTTEERIERVTRDRLFCRNDIAKRQQELDDESDADEREFARRLSDLKAGGDGR